MATETIKESAEPQHSDSEVCSHIQESSQTETAPKAEIHSRWKAGVIVPINMPVDECWRIVRNFASPQELITEAGVVTVVEGEPNAINCVRCLKGPNLDGTEGISWANERLLSNDDDTHIQTYRVEENSMGFVNYEAYIKVDRGNTETSVVTWSLEMDPMPGMSPPPNAVTQMMTGAFNMFIKYAESRYRQKQGIQLESPPVAIATA